MKVVKAQNQLPVEILEPKIISNNYTKELENAFDGEQIIIRSIENNIQSFVSTRKKAKKIFSEGFIKYFS